MRILKSGTSLPSGRSPESSLASTVDTVISVPKNPPMKIGGTIRFITDLLFRKAGTDRISPPSAPSVNPYLNLGSIICYVNLASPQLALRLSLNFLRRRARPFCIFAIGR